MSDNIALKNDDVTTVATVRTDEISSVHYPTTKISLGADGTHDGFVATGNPLPISDAGGSLTVDGTVAVTGVATTAAQTDGTQKTKIVDGSGNVIASTANALNVNIASGSVVTQYTEDVAAASDPVGSMGMAVRADTLAAVTSTDGDNIALRATNKGELYVKHADTLAISAASLPLPTGAATNTVLTDASQKTQVVDGAGAVIASTTNALHVRLASSAITLPISDAGGSLTIDGTVGISAGTAIMGKVGIDQTTPGTTNLVALAANQSVNQTQIGGVAVSVGHGTVDTGTQRVELPTDGTGVIAGVTTVTNITNQGNIVDNAAFTDGTSRLFLAGGIYDEVAGTALTENDAAAARINVNRAWVHCVEDGATRGRYLNVLVDNAAFTDGTTTLTAGGYIFDEVAGTSLSENDVAAARIDAKRAQVFVLEDATTRGQRQVVSNGAALVEISIDGGESLATGSGLVDVGVLRVTIASDSTGVIRSIAGTTGGWTPIKYTSAGTTNATSVKASAGSLGSITVSNANAARRFLKLYNKATAPTVGSDVPVAVYPIPITGSFSKDFGEAGLAFSLGIAFALTTAEADADTGAVSAGEHTVSIAYK